jgi:hypothetical protein
MRVYVVEGLARDAAAYRIASRYSSGSSYMGTPSRGQRLLSKALKKIHGKGIRDPSKLGKKGTASPEFRKRVATHMKKLKPHRWKL